MCFDEAGPATSGQRELATKLVLGTWGLLGLGFREFWGSVALFFGQLLPFRMQGMAGVRHLGGLPVFVISDSREFGSKGFGVLGFLDCGGSVLSMES